MITKTIKYFFNSIQFSLICNKLTVATRFVLKLQSKNQIPIVVTTEVSAS